MKNEKAKHTPGPWIYAKEGPTIVIHEKAKRRGDIARLSWWSSGVQDYNARLIATSPSMYDLLREVYSVLNETGQSTKADFIAQKINRLLRTLDRAK